MAFAANAVGVHRLCGQRNDKMSTCRQCWPFVNRFEGGNTVSYEKSLVLMGDNEGTDSHVVVG